MKSKRFANVLIGMLGLVLATLSLSAGMLYSVDRRNPMHLGDDPPTLKPPTRVEVYATGLGTGFDMTSAEYFLEKGKPQCVVTNSSEISDLLSVLQKSNSEQKIYNIFKTQGYEFHLFLFQDQDKTVMHLRVFEPVENKRHLLAISAESTAKSVVYNDQIGQWLHARVKAENKIIERQ